MRTSISGWARRKRRGAAQDLAAKDGITLTVNVRSARRERRARDASPSFSSYSRHRPRIGLAGLGQHERAFSRANSGTPSHSSKP